jgi:hypothetical protein
MTETEMFYARIASNIVALIMVMVSWRWRGAGRWLFVLLFLWASQINLRTAVGHPEAYLDYAPLAYSRVYREFILGTFARHITPIVGAIAAGQFAIAALISLRGRAVQLGLAGAIVFLLAIVPLGIGAGFPATLIMALAAAVLLRRRYDESLWSPLRRWVQTHARGERTARVH